MGSQISVYLTDEELNKWDLLCTFYGLSRTRMLKRIIKKTVLRKSGLGDGVMVSIFDFGDKQDLEALKRRDKRERKR